MEKFSPIEYHKELTFDLPIEYNGLVFTPVTVENYDEFYIAANCLVLDKNSIPDIKILKMSYLDYLFYLATFPETNYMLALLANTIKFSTKVELDDIRVFQNEKDEYFLNIKGNVFDKNKFLYMRDIICAQNDIDLSIFDLDPRVREELRKTMSLKSKSSNFEMGTLEEQIICVLISSNFTLEEIRNLSIRKFKKILNRVDHKLSYIICTLGSFSGGVKLSEEIPHWLNTLEKGKFDKLIASYDEVKSKVEMSNQAFK